MHCIQKLFCNRWCWWFIQISSQVWAKTCWLKWISFYHINFLVIQVPALIMMRIYLFYLFSSILAASVMNAHGFLSSSIFLICIYLNDDKFIIYGGNGGMRLQPLCPVYMIRSCRSSCPIKTLITHDVLHCDCDQHFYIVKTYIYINLLHQTPPLYTLQSYWKRLTTYYAKR